MSKVDEIGAAIQALSPNEQRELALLLPRILPQLDGDAEWTRIINSDQPNRTFSKYLDEVERELKNGSLELRETSDQEFRRQS